MRWRFASNLALLVLGAVLMTTSLTLPVGVVGWLALGVGCATVIVTLAGFASPGRGHLQRWLDAVLVALGGWTIISARGFAGAPVRWLAFSEAAALFALAAVGLLAHEVLAERERRRLRASGERPPVELRQPLPEQARVAAW